MIPNDFKCYLEEITNQNRERNKTIVNEVKEISTLLNENKIDHVFLKGAAMLACRIYKDVGERMIGDIDILVHPQQLFQAQYLLVKDGYKENKLNFRSKFKEYTHLDKLIPETKLATIEIHRKLLRSPVKNALDPLKILHDKRHVNSIAVPSKEDMLTHAILNFQINDFGHYYNFLGLRNTYDAIKLLKKIPEENLQTTIKNKYVSDFFQKVSIYFLIPSQCRKKKLFQLNIKMFLLKQKSRFFSKFLYKILGILRFSGIIINYFILFIHNSGYRSEVLNDRVRILKIIKLKFKSLY